MEGRGGEGRTRGGRRGEGRGKGEWGREGKRGKLGKDTALVGGESRRPWL